MGLAIVALLAVGLWFVAFRTQSFYAQRRVEVFESIVEPQVRTVLPRGHRLTGRKVNEGGEAWIHLAGPAGGVVRAAGVDQRRPRNLDMAVGDLVRVETFSAVRSAPSFDAAQVDVLRPGEELYVTGLMRERWAEVETENGGIGYIPDAALPNSVVRPFDELLGQPPVNPNKVGSISGMALVINTGTLRIGGADLRLAGVQGNNVSAGELDEWLSKRQPVSCRRPSRDQGFRCQTPGGEDVADAIVANRWGVRR